MIKYLEKSGRSEDDAIAAALAELGMDRDDVSVEILERAKSGFLGIGASPAVVRVSYEAPDEQPAPAPKAEAEAPRAPEKKPSKKPEAPKAAPAKKAEQPKPAPAPAPVDENEDYAAIRSFLSGLLERMNVQAEIEIGPRDNGGINVNLSGSGMGAIIGRRGETLDAIQHLTNYVVNHGSDRRLHISVDAENYRAKREESLTKLAEKMAEKAVKYKRSMALEPMNSYERHVIHTALQNYEGVTTSSTGVEPNRRVVVSYVKPEQPPKPQSREWA
ncbi:MAG: protein jag [Oscillospiraceae bacterium]|nr:protein jag [Oscillospiraceae bacterium]